MKTLGDNIILVKAHPELVENDCPLGGTNGVKDAGRNAHNYKKGDNTHNDVG